MNTNLSNKDLSNITKVANVDKANMREQPMISFTTVATGIYRSRYLWDLAASIKEHYGPDGWQLVVMTDKPEEVREFAKNLLIEVGHVGDFLHNTWPEGSMLRYESYSNINPSVFSESEYVVHLDADMLVRGKIAVDDLSSIRGNKVGLVLHPGFYRPSWLGPRTKFYLRNPKRLFSDLRSYLVIGGLGSWERNQNSQSFIPRRLRRRYFAGGVWMTTGTFFPLFVKQISAQISKDTSAGVIPLWHDESHLNSWAVKNGDQVIALPPTYCYADGYPALAGSKPIVEAVDKGAFSNR